MFEVFVVAQGRLTRVDDQPEIPVIFAKDIEQSVIVGGQCGE